MFILCHAAKNEPRKRAKGFPLGTLGARKNCRCWHLQCFCEDKHIQTLRWRLEVKAPTRKCHAINESKSFCPLLRTAVGTNFKQKRKAKTLANSKPICGVRYMPRRWRTLAKQKARRRLFSRRIPGVPRGNAWVSFLATSWETPRSSINRTARRVVSRHPATHSSKNSTKKPRKRTIPFPRFI